MNKKYKKYSDYIQHIKEGKAAYQEQLPYE